MESLRDIKEKFKIEYLQTYSDERDFEATLEGTPININNDMMIMLDIVIDESMGYIGIDYDEKLEEIFNRFRDEVGIDVVTHEK